jgi:anti-sigma regulatory factor (Ser/Thr protein kinase)
MSTAEHDSLGRAVTPESTDPWRSRKWLLRTHLELAPLPTAVPCARLHARQVLWEWGLIEHRDSLELIISELVTNAVAASQSLSIPTPVRLWMLSDHTRVLVLVWDGNPTEPAPGAEDLDAENGRGLMLVEAVCERWAWYFPEQSAGKVVWAIVTI